jgi:hypothetical protein
MFTAAGWLLQLCAQLLLYAAARLDGWLLRCLALQQQAVNRFQPSSGRER